MRFTIRILVAVGTLCFTVVLAGCDASSVRRPLRQSEQYRAVIAEYKTATVLPSEVEKEYGNRIWKQPLPADSPVFVIVFNLTRFARDKYDHFALRSHLQSLGISDTSTGKLMEGVLAAFAQFDNDVRSDRTRAGM
jgi:hypothetical protein